MATTPAKSERSQQILQSLAIMLEDPAAKITTATLAKHVGVSEAALYRHFPSKARMFEGLLDYMDEALFSRINQVMQASAPTLEKLYEITTVILVFAERNPGFCRLLTGEALNGENERLQARVSKVFERLTTDIKTVLRHGELQEGCKPKHLAVAQAELLTAVVQGKIAQYARSQFATKPGQYWQQQFALLSADFFE